MNDKPTTAPQFFVKLSGPRVGRAKLCVSDLSEIFKRTQQALKRVGQVLCGEESSGKGRKKKDIESQCELFLVGWEEGSAIATFELGPQPQQMDMFGCVGEESLKAFLAGMEVIAGEAYAETRLPPGYDSGVLEAVEALGKVFEHGIDTVCFSSNRNSFPDTMAYTKTVRERVRAGMGRPADLGHAVKVGRLEVLNGHGALRGNFWEANGTRWNCLFQSEHLDALAEAWMKNVKITGKIIEEEHLIEVDAMLVIEDDMMQTDTKTETSAFWQTVSLDDLAEEQGIGAAADLDSISAAWPADDDPDALLDFVLHERSQRRKVAAEQIA